MGVFRQFPYSNFHEMNLDEIIKIVKNMLEEWAQYYTTWDNWKEQVTQEWEEMQSFINDYFDNLDVQVEINNKITDMVNNGEFSSIVAPYIPPEVTSWLAEHITQPVGVVIDTSLSVAGACADAKATGDAIADTTNDIKSLNDKQTVTVNGTADTTAKADIKLIKGRRYQYTNNSSGAVNVRAYKADGTNVLIASNLDRNYTLQFICDSNDYVQFGGYFAGTGACVLESIDDGIFALSNKISTDYVTPEMYGAWGDGINDDTNAVIAAVTASKNVKFTSTYLITSDISMLPGSNWYGEGNLLLNDCSILIDNTAREQFRLANLNIIMRNGSSKPSVKITHCFGGVLDNINIMAETEFINADWPGILIYADDATGGTSFIKFNNIHISGASSAIVCNSLENSYISSCHFNNIVIERFTYYAVSLKGYKTNTITFNNITIDDNYASGYDKMGIRIENVSTVFFYNLIIWADAAGHGTEFYAIYIIDMATYLSPDRFYGYVEGYLEDHTMSMLAHCKYDFFYQKVISATNTRENIGVITN